MNGAAGHNMDKQAFRTAYLIAGFLRGALTSEEHDELDEWIGESDANMKLFEELTDEKHLADNMAWMDRVNSTRSFRQLKIKRRFDPAPSYRKWIWAGSTCLVLLVAALVRYNYQQTLLPKKKPASLQATLQPGNDKATLQLDDGRIINLDTAGNGVLAKGVEKTKEGQLVYSLVPVQRANGWHTLSTPVGGQYRVLLPDGSLVWLNASSILKYPAGFPDSERTVTLKGEAYFEVAKEIRRPFRVLLEDTSVVKVLGTHFNIMNYPGESSGEVTLLEGKIQFDRHDQSQALFPGQQLKISPAAVTKVMQVDTEEIVGWKNGLFVFHETDIASIMRQVARWYDVKVVYRVSNPELFTATIPRSEPLQKLLHILELTGKIHFKIEDKIIYVLP